MSTICFDPEIISSLTVKELTTEIQTAIDTLKHTEGGELIFSSGLYTIGSLELCSNLTMTLEAGAILRFDDTPDLYPKIMARYEGKRQTVYQACLYGNHLHNVTLAGHGTIDGNGHRWWQAFKAKELPYCRPYLLSIENSDHLNIENLIFQNSPAWTIHPIHCDNVSIRNISVHNPKDAPNTDGLNPESCTHLRIDGCFFDVGDDCIAIKAGIEKEQDLNPCEDIIISNCNMAHGHGGIVFGSEMSGNIKGVTITNCTFRNTDRGIRFKTRRGRGGQISEVTATNIVMDHVLCPIVVNSSYAIGFNGQPYTETSKDEALPGIKNILFDHLIATNIQACAGFIYGIPNQPIQNLTIKDSIFELDPKSKPSQPAMIAEKIELSQYGFYIQNTHHCSLKEITITGTSKLLGHNVHNDQLQVQ